MPPTVLIDPERASLERDRPWNPLLALGCMFMHHRFGFFYVTLEVPAGNALPLRRTCLRCGLTEHWQAIVDIGASGAYDRGAHVGSEGVGVTAAPLSPARSGHRPTRANDGRTLVPFSSQQLDTLRALVRGDDVHPSHLHLLTRADLEVEYRHLYDRAYAFRRAR